jgi:hypothetical protein
VTSSTLPKHLDAEQWAALWRCINAGTDARPRRGRR